MEQVFLWAGVVLAVLALATLLATDWPFLTRRCITVSAKVVGHRLRSDGDGESYTAILEYADSDGKIGQVDDWVAQSIPKPGVGALVELSVPRGKSDSARICRPWWRAAIYVTMFYLLFVLIGRLFGWLSPGDGAVAGL